MAKPQLPDNLIEQIKAAPTEESHEKVASRLLVSVAVVRKYRRQGRQERQEVAREIVARHVEANIPDALADLSDLRRIARQNFEASGDARQGNLWLGAIKTTLEHVTPDDAELDAMLAAEIAKAADADQKAGPRPSAGIQSFPALH